MGVFGHEFLQALHQELDLEKGQVLTAAGVHQYGLGLLEQGALVEQRTGDGFAEGHAGAILAIGDARAEEAGRGSIAESADQIVEAEVDESWARDDAGDGANGFADELVGGREGIVGTLLGEHRFAHAVVVEGDQRVGVGGKFCEGVVGLLAAAFPFESEGHGGDDHHKGTCLAGDARDSWRGTRSRATAKTDADEDKLMAFDAAAQ